MPDDEKYEELRKYFEGEEAREQKYIVIITKLMIENSDLKKRIGGEWNAKRTC